MAPFSIPAPCIVPLRVPSFAGPRSIDTLTKIELTCETYLAHEIFYTLDGTKPQPYAGIVQGSKHFKYKSPFCLPAGKITIKAVALNSYVHSMRSSVVTKYFDVVKAECDSVAKKGLSKIGKKEYPKKSRKTKPLGDVFPTKPLTSLTNGNAENINIELDENVLENFERKNSSSSLDDFPPDLDFDVGDVLESQAASIADGADELEVLQVENDEDTFSIPSIVTENEQHSHKDDSSILDDPKCKSPTEEEEKLKVEDGVPNRHASAEVPTYCVKCETILQHCHSCMILNAITSKYCIQCGESLTVLCTNCKELNSVMATFCHYCGKKIEPNDVEKKEPQISYADRSTMAETPKTHAGVQQTLSTVNMQTQTPPFGQKERITKKDFLSPQKKKLPAHSPGRGYWHQQLDYICNHLKSYAYNNVEFRESISEPMLSEFREALVSKSDDGVTVTLSFAPFVWEKGKDSKNLKEKDLV